jgi:moderate conductance mechanosensitive channel
MINFFEQFMGSENTLGRVLVILFLALGSHGVVLMVKALWRYLMGFASSKPQSKFKSVASLTQSFLIFILYFGAFGLILREMGVSLTAYLASASVLGLAIGFGSQGLVQDVVTGLTLVLTDLINIGNMVEIGGQTGIIRSIGMRFIVIENALGAEVFVPNRSIMNVISYPRGYVRCIVDVTLSNETGFRDKMKGLIEETTNSFVKQFPGILIKPFSIEGLIKTAPGKEILRIKFRIWPGRGTPIETLFKQELIQRLKIVDSSYSDWMVSVNYEVEKASPR